MIIVNVSQRPISRTPVGRGNRFGIYFHFWRQQAAQSPRPRTLTPRVDGATVREGAAAATWSTLLARAAVSRGRLVRFTAVTTTVAFAALNATAVIGQVADTTARSLAATCANCHGTGGVSAGGLPSLAGRPREEIVRTMQEFKSDARPATVMNQLAKGYTDEQVAAIAAWFAAQNAPK